MNEQQQAVVDKHKGVSDTDLKVLQVDATDELEAIQLEAQGVQKQLQEIRFVRAYRKNPDQFTETAPDLSKRVPQVNAKGKLIKPKKSKK